MTDENGIRPEDLGNEVQWVHALARRLIGDEHLAADVAQETCVAALHSPPRETGHLRAWLATVMRNVLRQEHRSSARRREREVAVARPEASPDPGGVVDKAVSLGELVNEVLALGEPYRTTVLLRFVEDLPPREVAQRMDTPVATVHTRLTRGLAQLRERLDRKRGGDATAWLLALLPVRDWAPVATATATASPWGIVLVNAKLKIAAATVAGGAVLVSVATLGDDPGEAFEPRVAVASEEPKLAPEPAELAQLSSGSGGRRTAEPAAAEALEASTPDAEPAAALESHLFQGRVLGVEGVPLAGVRVHTVGNPLEAAARSGAGGWFELEARGRDGRIEAAEPGYATVLSGNVVTENATIAPVVVVAEEITLGGRVIDSLGRAVSGADVNVRMPEDFRHRFGDVLDESSSGSHSTTTDAAGHFLFEDIPAVRGASLVASREGYVPGRVEAPELTEEHLSIELSALEVTEGELQGVVLDVRGLPVPRARVAYGLQEALTGEDGRFHIPRETWKVEAPMMAVKAGHLPGRAEPDRGPDGEPLWPAFIELQLGGRPESISGRVVDDRGEPAADKYVWVADPTFFGNLRSMPTHVEKVLRGADEPKEDDSGLPSLGWDYVRTDAEGRFELGGLLEREYNLYAFDGETLVRGESGPVPAGADDVEIRLPYDDVHDVVAGVVRTVSGQPLADVHVSVVRNVSSISIEYEPGASTSMNHNDSGAETRTDAEGRFRFRDVPRGDLFLAFGSDRIVSTSVALEEVEDVADLDVVAHQRCHFEVELTGALAEADTVGALGENDRPMQLYVIRGGNSWSSTTVDLVDGQSGVLAVRDDAHTLVFTRDGEELGRHPLDLVPGEVVVVRP